MNKQNPPDDFTGLWIYKCPTGMVYEKEFVHGEEHGVYRHKNLSGIALREGVKHEGLDHGVVTVRDSEGNVLDNYQFNYGTGIHRIYTSLGVLGWVIPYKDGLQHGMKYHYINGGIVSEQEYCNGQKI